MDETVERLNKIVAANPNKMLSWKINCKPDAVIDQIITGVTSSEWGDWDIERKRDFVRGLTALGVE